MLNIIVRVDASTVIGSGHLMRCLTLGKRLRCLGHDVTFIMRAHRGSMQSVVEQQGFSYRMLERPRSYHGKEYESWLGGSQTEDAVDTIAAMGTRVNLLIVDHYALDYEWETLLRPHVNSIFVIDDLANRHHSCDFLLDANLGAEQGDKYAGLLSRHCRSFLGLSYLMLRQEFYNARTEIAEKGKAPSNVLTIFICFGGSDPTNETLRTLQILAQLPQKIDAHVVLGASNPHRAEVESFCQQYHWRVYCQIDYVACLMRDSDCAIGAGGTMTWERCYMGLPTLVVAIAENQREDAILHDEMGLIVYAGFCEDITDEKYEDAIVHFLSDKQKREHVRAVGRSVFENEQVEEMLKVVTASVAAR